MKTRRELEERVRELRDKLDVTDDLLDGVRVELEAERARGLGKIPDRAEVSICDRIVFSGDICGDRQAELFGACLGRWLLFGVRHSHDVTITLRRDDGTKFSGRLSKQL